MGGCGIIIYYLREPYDEFVYNASSEQWKELFRSSDNTWWIEQIEKINDTTIFITVEDAVKVDGIKYELNVYSLELTKVV